MPLLVARECPAKLPFDHILYRMCSLREISSFSFALVRWDSELAFRVLIVTKLSDYFVVSLQAIIEFFSSESRPGNLIVAIVLHRLLSPSLLSLYTITKCISKVFNSRQNHRGLSNNLRQSAWVGVKKCKVNLLNDEALLVEWARLTLCFPFTSR